MDIRLRRIKKNAIRQYDAAQGVEELGLFTKYSKDLFERDFIPALCYHMRIQGVPDSSVAMWTSEHLDSVRTVFACFQGLFQSMSSYIVKGDISYGATLARQWPRIWQWCRFFLTEYHDKWKESAAPEVHPARAYALAMQVLSLLSSEGHSRVLMRSSSEFLSAATSLWLEGYRFTAEDHFCLGSTLRLLAGEPDPNAKTYVRSMFAGRWPVVAPMILDDLDNIVSRKGFDASDLSTLEPNIGLLVQFELHVPTIRSHLITHNSISIICKVMKKLASWTFHPNEVTVHEKKRCLHSCFKYIDSATEHGGHIAIAKALKARFLVYLFRAIGPYPYTPVDEYRTSLLQTIRVIKSYLIYDSILRLIPASFHKIDRLTPGEDVLLTDPEIRSSWLDFRFYTERLLKERARCKQLGHIFRCDGPRCINSNLMPKHVLRRCSACKSVVYCSKTCQRDHRRSIHANQCRMTISLMREAQTNSLGTTPLTTTDAAYIRWRCWADICEQYSRILDKLEKILRKSSYAAPWISVNYTSAPPTITLVDMSDLTLNSPEQTMLPDVPSFELDSSKEAIVVLVTIPHADPNVIQPYSLKKPHLLDEDMCPCYKDPTRQFNIGDRGMMVYKKKVIRQ